MKIVLLFLQKPKAFKKSNNKFQKNFSTMTKFITDETVVATRAYAVFCVKDNGHYWFIFNKPQLVVEVAR